MNSTAWPPGNPWQVSNQQEAFVLDASSTQLRPRPLDVPGGRVVARSRVFRYWHSSLWQVACTFSRCSVLSLCSPFVVFSQAVSWPPLSLFLFSQKEQHSLSHNFPQLGLCVCRAFAPKSRHFCSFLALPEQTKVFGDSAALVFIITRWVSSLRDCLTRCSERRLSRDCVCVCVC